MRPKKSIPGVLWHKEGQYWYIDYRLPNGRRYREKIGEDKKLAETVLAKRRVEIAEGRFLDKKKKEKIHFEDFAQVFLRLHSANKKCKADYFNMKTLNRFFKGKYLYAITAEDIERFKAKRSEEVSNATINRELCESSVQGMFVTIRIIGGF